MVWQPLWSVQGSTFTINTTVWFTTLGAIAFGTFISAKFTKDGRNISKSNAPKEEYECTECGASVAEDQAYCHKSGEKFEG